MNPAQATDWIGRKAERRIRITVEMLDQFVALSGDASEIHVSEQSASERGFTGRVAHGMLLGALLSGVIGTELPGNDGVMQQMQLSFRAPCSPGDEVAIQLSVVDFYESVQAMLINVKIVNAAGVLLATGQVQSGLRPRCVRLGEIS